MQDENQTHTPVDPPSRSDVRHRPSVGLAGWLAAHLTDRRRALALGSAAVVIAGLAVAASTLDADGSTVTTASVGQGLAERNPGDRADRADRTAQTPSAVPSAPSALAAPPSTPAAPPSTPAAPPSTPAAPPAAPKPKPAWVNPMPGATVTSCYGPRWGTLHQGVDFAAPPSTPVRAVGAGVVVGAGWLYGGYGISVMIDHGNGYRTHYAHLKFTKVAPGQRVSADQMIGAEGSTGDSTGPHLHFEVHRGAWAQIEPVRWLRDRGVRVPGC